MVEMHRIKYEYEHQGKKYMVHIEKRKADRLTLYIGGHIFLSQLTNERYLKTFQCSNGGLSQFEKDIIDHITVKDIKRCEPEPDIFKKFGRG